MFSRSTFHKAVRIILALTTLGFLAWLAPAPGSFAQEGEQSFEAESFELVPVTGKALEVPHPEISAELAKRLLNQEYRLRLEAAKPYNVDTSAEALAGSWPAAEESSAAEYLDARFHGVPSDFVIGSNVLNTQADNAGNSTLAEPAAANEGPNVFYAGNFAHSEFSTNGGATWTNVTVPAGPADAPTGCCDWDVVYDQARGVTFYSTLYRNNANPPTNGIVRIFVRRDMSLATNCFYDIDPAGTGNNTVPDYPHINISNDFLYLGTNNVGGAAGSRAQMYRINIDQMTDCVAASGNIFTYLWSSGVGQRIFVPIEGARETMFWFVHEDSNTLRIYRWPESTTTVSSVLRDIGASSFGVNEDCSGGTGNADWWDSLAASIIGFGNRGALGNGRLHLYWPVASDASHTQGHIHGAIFAVNPSGAEHVVGAASLAQPVIFNNSFCFGLPQVSANERGDVGMDLAVGGNLGAACTSLGCSAAQPAVGIDDDFTAGLGLFGAAGGNFTLYAAGTHNRADARYGDYFVIHPHEPCDLWFGATGYALNGGTGVANVNARWIEFGRQRDKLCYDRWDDEDPVP